MKGIILLALLFASTTFANSNAGLKAGARFEENNLRGTVTMYCPTRTQIVNCNAAYLSPSTYSKFIYNGATDATDVELNRDGARSVKKSRFNSETLESKKSFNLWVGSLLQRPLLKRGVNVINYTLKGEDKEVVERGQFEVLVEQSPTRLCPWDTYRSFNDNDCRSGGQHICNAYFQRHRLCR